ncbi:SC5A9-like protein [Mya arenaria]|uniref:SC5A9-like protein n=1 Tax=Mya arenaria TaxID=6604 RepID=A0ABY7DNB8_MYAAR|nr:SC5A9-like protein [Mya arenaria]
MVEKLVWEDYLTIGIYFAVVLAVGIGSSCRPNRGSAAGYFLAGKNMHWIPAVYFLILLGWVFVPVYVACGAYTMPEYLKKRLGGRRIRLYSSVLSLVEYILHNISAEIYSGAIFMQALLGWNIYLCVIVILAVTAVYTIAALIDVGGWEGLMTKYPLAATNYTLANQSFYECGMPRDDAFHIWRSATTGDIPWPGALIGLTTLGLFTWCQDQVIVQRCLSAKNLGHAKAGSVLAAFLKLFGFLLFVIPGMISRINYTDDIACASPEKCFDFCGNKAGYSRLNAGSLTCSFNEFIDIHFQQRKLYSYVRYLQSQGGILWFYLQAVKSYLVVPWCMLFLLAFFWKRLTEQGAFWGLMVGLVVGLIRMGLDFAIRAPYCGSGETDERYTHVSNTRITNLKAKKIDKCFGHFTFIPYKSICQSTMQGATTQT